ncbi:MAG: diguanylate cyclase [Pseudomonadota bacterium]|nr:diguanylate cyclase [Pseudomonadota bacterium]
MIFKQVVDMANIGIVILDRELYVRHWNNWMAMRTGIAKEKILGVHLFDHFPNLDNPRFLRNVKSTLTFGNYLFFSQKLHHYLFPMPAEGSLNMRFDKMQQSCTSYPLRDEDNRITHVCITVQDVTAIAAYEAKLLDMNLRDSLTGAYNRRFLAARLKEEIDRHKRYGRTLSLLMLDIDYFKNVNDTYGHHCGDSVLKSICEVISAMLRNVDLLIRFGGEEFCCLLPETDLAAAMILAERIRKSIEQEVFRFEGREIRLTVSLGVHELHADHDSPESLLRNADKALYRAKETGRNCVFCM